MSWSADDSIEQSEIAMLAVNQKNLYGECANFDEALNVTRGTTESFRDHH